MWRWRHRSARSTNLSGSPRSSGCKNTAQSSSNWAEALRAPSFAPASVTSAELGAAAAYLDRAVPLLQSEQDSINAAGEPATNRDMFHSVLTALSAHVDDQVAARAAADARKLTAFRKAVAADQSDATRLAGVASQFGLVNCD